MKKKTTFESGIFTPRVLFAFIFCSVGLCLTLFSLGGNQGDGSGMPPGPSSFFSGPSTGEKVKSVYRGMPIEYEIANGKAIFQGDIILESAGIDAVTVDYGNYLWPKVGNQYQMPTSSLLEPEI